MTYATVEDLQARMSRQMTDTEAAVASTLLDDAGVLIDATDTTVDDVVKLIVSCRMVMRAIGDGMDGIPIGASQGSMSGLGYSQSWTIGNSGSVGELYFSKADKKLLKIGNLIGSHSPTQEMCGVTS